MANRAKSVIPCVALWAALASCGERAGPQPGAATASAPAAQEPAESDEGRRLRQLEEARAAYERDPGGEEALVWYGRRLAYLGRFEEAVALYGRGLERHPESHVLLRHRGHRLISLRRYEEASRDLARAAALAADDPDEIEPDGQPNAAGVPRSTIKFNIGYHLGLSWYLRGEYEEALRRYREAMELSTRNDDLLVATSYWLYLTLARLGRDDEARAVLEPIRAEMDLLENHAYHELLLLYRGERTPDAVLSGGAPGGVELATRGYGVGMHHLLAGDEEAARDLFERVCASDAAPAFGYLAAEAELARMP